MALDLDNPNLFVQSGVWCVQFASGDLQQTASASDAAAAVSRKMSETENVRMARYLP